MTPWDWYVVWLSFWLPAPRSDRKTEYLSEELREDIALFEETGDMSLWRTS